MAEIKSGSSIGGNVAWHSGNLRFDIQGNTIRYAGFKMFTENDPPRPSELADGGSYTKAESDSRYTTVVVGGYVAKTGDIMSGNLRFLNTQALQSNYGGTDLNLIRQGGSSSNPVTIVGDASNDATQLISGTNGVSLWHNGSQKLLTITSGTRVLGQLEITTNIPVAVNHATRKDYVDGLDAQNVKITGNQSIAGEKSFSNRTVFQQSLNVNDVIGYTEVAASGVTNAMISMTGVVIGGAASITWDTTGNEMIRMTRGTTNSNHVFSVAGIVTSTQAPSSESHLTRKDYVDGLDAQNVKLTGNQTVAGIKTHSSNITFANNGQSTSLGNAAEGGLQQQSSFGWTKWGQRNGTYSHFDTSATTGFYSFKQWDMPSVVLRDTQLNQASAATRKDYVDTQVGTRLPLTGGTLTGNLAITVPSVTASLSINADTNQDSIIRLSETGGSAGAYILYNGAGSNVTSFGTRNSGVDTSFMYVARSSSSPVFNGVPRTDGTQGSSNNELTRKDYVDGLDGQNVKLTGDQNIAGSKTFDNGQNTTVTIRSNDNGTSLLQLIGDIQGTGKIFVGQSPAFGGGIIYNGDLNPHDPAGPNIADVVSLYRRDASVDSWVMYWAVNSNNVNVRGNVAAHAAAPTDIDHLTRKDYVDNGLSTKLNNNQSGTVSGVLTANRFVSTQQDYNMFRGGSYHQNWTGDATQGAAIFALGQKLLVKQALGANPAGTPTGNSAVSVFFGGAYRDAYHSGNFLPGTGASNYAPGNHVHSLIDIRDHYLTGRNLNTFSNFRFWSTIYRSDPQDGTAPENFVHVTNFPGDTARGTQIASYYGGSSRFHIRSKADTGTYANDWKPWVQLYTDDYHPNADTWTTARTISLSGDATGSVSINGSSNVTLTVDVQNHLPLTGGTLTGNLSINRTSANGEFAINTTANRDSAMRLSEDGGQHGAYFAYRGQTDNAITIGTRQNNVNTSFMYANRGAEFPIFPQSPRVDGSQSSASNSLTRKDYVDTQVGTRLPLTGGTLTGRLIAVGTANNPTGGAVEVRGNGSSVIPVIGFHQPGSYSSSLQLSGNGDFRFVNSSGGFGNAGFNQWNINGLSRSLGPISGAFGTVQANGLTNSWAGYSISGRVVFMHDNSNTAGLFDDVNNQWQLQSTLNGRTGLYFAGIERLSTTTTGAQATGNFVATGNLTANSDIKLKKDIEVIPNALDKVKSVRGVTYTRKDSGERQTGVVAQEIEKILPEAVIETDDTKSVAYGNLVGLLIESTKELSAKVDSLQEEVKELRKPWYKKLFKL